MTKATKQRAKKGPARSRESKAARQERAVEVLDWLGRE